MPAPPLSPSQQVERIREILVGRQMQLVEERLERLERLIGDSPIRKPAPLSAPFPNSPPTHEEAFAPQKVASTTLPDQSGNRDEQIAALHALISQTGKQLGEANRTLNKHDQLLTQDLRQTLEEINSSVATRIDARCREVLEHFESELHSLHEKLASDLQRVSEMKADRTELQTRLSRIADAAMNDESPLLPSDGFTP